MFSLNLLLPKVILCLQNVAFKQKKTKFMPPHPAKIVKKPYYHLPCDSKQNSLGKCLPESSQNNSS